jgi:glutamate 5-kinase
LELKRVIIKIGSALIAENNGTMRRAWMAALATDVAAWRAKGREVIIVTSGAGALGRGLVGLTREQIKRALSMEEKQAATAIGQPLLMHAWEEMFKPHNVITAQVLLTLDDTEDRQRHLTCRGAIEKILKLGALPIINENDTVSTAEIRIGDNDRLAARVAQMISADTLILLSDIDGLYTADPKTNPSATFIPEVKEITADIEAMAGDPQPGMSSGGMKTKIMAAKIAVSSGCRMAILKGTEENPLQRLDDGRLRCTWFTPSTNPLAARKRWIAAHMSMKGSIIIDDGALKALHDGKSLLPIGVKKCEGIFSTGDAVFIKTLAGLNVGCGLVAFDRAEADKICGRRSDDIESLLGYAGQEEMIHRDNMVLNKS